MQTRVRKQRNPVVNKEGAQEEVTENAKPQRQLLLVPALPVNDVVVHEVMKYVDQREVGVLRYARPAPFCLLAFAFFSFSCRRNSRTQACVLTYVRQVSPLWDEHVAASISELYVDGQASSPPKSLNAYTNLTALTLHANEQLGDIGLSALTNLQEITLSHDTAVTDATLVRQGRLQCLTLGYPHCISSAGVLACTGLASLNVLDRLLPRQHGPAQYFPWLKSNALTNLTGLESLMLSYNQSIHSHGFSNLVSLRVLNVDGASGLTDAALAHTVSLRALIFNRGVFGDLGLLYVAGHLEILSLSTPSRVTDAGLAVLTNLRVLTVAHCNHLTGSCLPALTNLRELGINNCSFQGYYIARVPSTVTFASLTGGMTGPVDLNESHLAGLTQLRFLSLGPLGLTMERVFPALTNLANLHVNGFGKMTRRAVSVLPLSLVSLTYDCGYALRVPAVPTDPVTRLTNLTCLRMPYQNDIAPEHISPLVHLTKLVAGPRAASLREHFYHSRPDLLIVERQY